ncbi:MAG TPA: DUF5916 domain-containing protein [Calditrichia bacterium]|nr:carbohydrate binding family 9 domain-containing protein [Calditrichota bacterium]HQU71437.1 DUF5916 domain-containing protein [Calditrichia bacterium]HQV30233.1 DUF5916 domain-containing protein [Calditrichia bacterium]
MVTERKISSRFSVAAGKNLRLAGILLIACSAVFAQDTPPPERIQIRAVKVPDGSISLDGSLDEKAWEKGHPASDFRQRMPNEGVLADKQTEVRFLFDSEALFIGARMYSDNGAERSTQVSRRDNAGNAERIIISLDTYLDRITAYSFGITAKGVRIDYYHPTDAEFSRDYSFDPVWEAKTQFLADGWSAEVRIPFSQLRFSSESCQIWGVNINRWIPDINQDTYWIYPRSQEVGWSSRFGSLDGLGDVKPRRGVELLPYFAGEGFLRSDVDAGDPLNDDTDFRQRAGLDLKMGLGPNLTLDATINPDFGQVEADPAEVNLTDFETFFSERRPFFTEGQQLLSGQGPGFYYSRRIGAPPPGFPAGQFVRRPQQTTILGAAKLTGRLNSGLNIGALAASTGREFAEIASDSSDEIRKVEVQAPAVYGVIRLQKELDQKGSTAGFSGTAVERQLKEGSDVAQLVNRRAYGGGVDWRLKWLEGRYRFSGDLGFSYVAGSEVAIAALQRSPARYFQRPDADHFSLDSARTHLAGYSFSAGLGKESGRHWLWDLSLWGESPGFEINDLGQLRRADEVGTGVSLKYRETTPGRIFQNWSHTLSNYQDWTFGGENTGHYMGYLFSSTLRNYWSLSGYGNFQPRYLSQTATRGGPLMGTGRYWEFGLSWGNNFASRNRWTAAGEYAFDELGSRKTEVSVSMNAQPTSSLGLQVTPFWQSSLNTRQYVATLENGRPETFDRRYVFGAISRRTLSLQMRLDWAFTPNLTAQVYAEPFAADGRYSRFGELAEPRSPYLRMYGEGGSSINETDDGVYAIADAAGQFVLQRPDFRVRSLRSSMVIRWEWRPGSTLFLVWQQDRSGSGDPRDSRADFRDLAQSFEDRGNHILALKFSYWLPVQ